MQFTHAYADKLRYLHINIWQHSHKLQSATVNNRWQQKSTFPINISIATDSKPETTCSVQFHIIPFYIEHPISKLQHVQFNIGSLKSQYIITLS